MDALGSLLVYLRIAVRALRGHLFRSFLTTLSILIGGFSIVLMSSLAAGGLATLSRGIEDLGGARLLMVWGKDPDRARGKTASYNLGITLKDRDALFAAMPHVEGHTMYATLGQLNVSADGGHYVKTDFVAADGSFLDAYQLHVEKGRGFTEEESRGSAKVCVVGHDLAKKLYNGDAVGKWMVNGKNERCRIVGQLAKADRFGINMGFDWSDLTVWPIGTVAATQPEALKGVQFLFKTDDEANNDIAKRVANAILSERHNGVDDFELFDFATFMVKWHATIGIMEGIVGFIAGIALLVGGVGVMNMMLVSVSERVREIGIRKALGASPRAIRTQFLCEAMLLSGFGGALGVGLGIGAALGMGPLLRSFTPSWVNVVATGAAVNALIVSISIGLLFGYFPARRASKLDAITAMRR
jgi:putative ABC transport system permease protein